MPDIDFALVLNLHQPAGNLDDLLTHREWEAKEILWALDRIPRSLWGREDVARVHVALSGTLLETLADPRWQERAYGIVDCGSLLWHLLTPMSWDELRYGSGTADSRERPCPTRCSGPCRQGQSRDRGASTGGRRSCG